MLESRHVLSTFTIINTDDSGAGSLRQAILDANTNPDADIIQFATSLAGTITLTSGELAITESVDLQGPGASVVTVSGNNASRVFNVSANATISSLTITGGSADAGGGIFNAGTLAVSNATLSGNSADFGGGIRNDGTLTLDGSTFSDNTSIHFGGGIDNNGTLTVDNNTLSGNSASAGGGIFNRVTLTMQNSTLGGNSALLSGGGIANGGTLTVDSSAFSGNSADLGGGINNGGMLTVNSSTLSGNSASTGAGISNSGTLTLDSSTLSGNSAGYGGGIANGGTLTMHNSTLSGNSGIHFGGGINNGDSGTLTLDSSTFSGNSSNVGGGIYTRGASTLDNTIVAASFDEFGGPSSDIDGSVASSSSHNLISVDTNLSGISHGSNGNQVGTAAAPINPMLGALQDNGGPTETMALLPGSPAINAGDNSLIPAGMTTDQRGLGYARIDNGTVDIGAFELVVDNDPSTFIVTNLADSGIGSLRQAVLNANDNPGSDIVQFAAGLSGTITLTSGELAVTDDAVDIQGPGASVITVSGNNVSRVFRVTANATISGLTISGGSSSNGGAISNAYGTLTVQNSTLSGNSASQNGGGIYNAYGTLTVDNSILSGNSASQKGGGIYNANYGTFTVIQNSTLNGNSASNSEGAGIFNAGTLAVSNAALSGNSAAFGGGIRNDGTLTLDSSTLSDNSSIHFGGGIDNNGTLTVDNSTLSGNSANAGGGIFNRVTLTMQNSTFSGNSALLSGGGIANGGTLTVDGSAFSGNSAEFGGAINNGGTATVNSSTLSGNSASTGGGIFNSGTLTLDSSTLSGNSAGYGGGIANGGTLTMHNSTLSGNSGIHFGGGINNGDSGTLTLDSSTLSGNSSNVGGGIYTRGASTLNNTIVAANSSVDIDGPIASSSSHNLIGVDTNLSGISHGSNGNQVGTAAAPINPMLGTLQDNGGPTETMALLPGSSALNAGDNTLIPAGVTTDQRGVGYARIDNGTVDIGAFELVVNQPPVADAGGPYTVVRGGDVDLDASGSSDPNQPNTTLNYSWDLDGDGVFGETGAFAGRGDETGLMPTFSAAGLNDAGTMTVSLRVTDGGGLSAVDSATVTVVIAALQDDPLAPGQTMLVVGGGTGDDTIRIRTDGVHGGDDADAEYITIRINEHEVANRKIRGKFALPISRVVVYGQAGEDDVKVGDDTTVPAWLYGGEGHDRLNGGAGRDVLLGGAGDDFLAGSDGRDLLIGGTGADRIVGNAGDDILIAGTTDFDAREAALALIMQEWTRTDAAFATRVSHLKTGGGLNNENLLTDATVHDDHAEDILTGNSGDDWFLFNRDGDGGVKDKVTDKSTFESHYAEDIDWLNNGL